MRGNHKRRARGRAVRFVIVAGVLLTVWSALALAQTGRGGISGRVTDSGGAVLRAARVELYPGGQVAITMNAVCSQAARLRTRAE